MEGEKAPVEIAKASDQDPSAMRALNQAASIAYQKNKYAAVNTYKKTKETIEKNWFLALFIVFLIIAIVFICLFAKAHNNYEYCNTNCLLNTTDVATGQTNAKLAQTQAQGNATLQTNLAALKAQAATAKSSGLYGPQNLNLTPAQQTQLAAAQANYKAAQTASGFTSNASVMSDFQPSTL